MTENVCTVLMKKYVLFPSSPINGLSKVSGSLLASFLPGRGTGVENGELEILKSLVLKIPPAMTIVLMSRRERTNQCR